MAAEPHPSFDEQLQVLDVHLVDVLAHLEALLRHSHSIQRALLQMRSESPPPRTSPPDAPLAGARRHGRDMRRECSLLAEIIDDLAAGIELMDGASDAARAAGERSGGKEHT